MRISRKKHAAVDEQEIERKKKAKAWLVSSALEGIVPDDMALADMKLLDSGKMTPEQFEKYIIAKYRVIE